ncbi:hypothetical protein PPL_01937 [Heterostelium album PN500]|uniref:Uncharacterized protein n=1 Tax=Heterostelium pallidum (strain ATCC 26659 / Pp 5 / PN500) TaxID=670386 RepID=D3B0X0_HETP5|nr:hypothetical protein PPL_01937 [Heterostelium album PN500]EFA84944.1 hypothetical protein PPL_01937 [Heterostelium album PN500]|eukprot:XP_020437054.1 hypothetical protein PPL_01937 [Heterostelium album PN500]
MSKQSIFLILLLNILSCSLVQSGDCIQQLAKYMDFEDHTIQMTAVMKTGQVYYTRQRITGYPIGTSPNLNFITNIDNFPVRSADDNKCVNGGTSQPFTKPITSCYESCFRIYPYGKFVFHPVWILPGDSGYVFNLTCTPNSSVMYGQSQVHTSSTFLSILIVEIN